MMFLIKQMGINFFPNDRDNYPNEYYNAAASSTEKIFSRALKENHLCPSNHRR